MYLLVHYKVHNQYLFAIYYVLAQPGAVLNLYTLQTTLDSDFLEAKNVDLPDVVNDTKSVICRRPKPHFLSPT